MLPGLSTSLRSVRPTSAGVCSLRGILSDIRMLHQPWSEDVFSLEVNNPIFEVRYSCRKLSTGSSWAARMAGTVPNKSPTSALAAIAMIADVPEIGIR